jgi:hypothetical protein
MSRPVQLRHSGFLLQSNFGKVGNFELAVPSSNGGINLYWRNNDSQTLPWSGPVAVAPGLGLVEGVSMIQAAWGTAGLGDLFAVVPAAGSLWETGRADTTPFSWGEPAPVTVAGAPVSGVHGAPVAVGS